MSETATNSTPGDGKVSKGGLFDYFKDTTTKTPTSAQCTPSGQSQLMVAYKKPKLSQYVGHNNKCSFMVEFEGKMHPCGAKTDKHNVGRHFRDKHADYQGESKHKSVFTIAALLDPRTARHVAYCLLIYCCFILMSTVERIKCIRGNLDFID